VDFVSTPEGKIELGTLQQCERHIRPLFKLLKRNKLSTEILDLLYLIVQYCLMREYVKAHEKYVELGIGNSPWPMGVTMIGIHERSGRSRIFTSQQAHVLNDDTQRRYVQQIKRLMTLCQKNFAADPSKSVL
jgi:pre-mRNA-splicing factor 18